jgi:predicted dehydrogenase
VEEAAEVHDTAAKAGTVFMEGFHYLMVHDELRMSWREVGTRGEATAVNFVLPYQDDRIRVRTSVGERVEEIGRRSSYAYQLDAYAAHLRHGEPLPLDADDALATMRMIDECCRKAGFAVRPRS